MKKIVVTAIIVLNLIICASCNNEKPESHLSSSYELSLVSPIDTINVMINGLKQGIWIKTKNGKKDTVYYKNDTLIK